MIISLRVRRNKIDVTESRVDDQFMLFDNVRDVVYSKRPEKTTKPLFKQLRDSSLARRNVTVMLKDPSLCEDQTEEYHYNVVSFIDGNTGEAREIVYDTIAFLMNDKGDTLVTLKG